MVAPGEPEPASTPPEGEEAKKEKKKVLVDPSEPARLRGGIWFIVSVLLEPAQGRISTFLNGHLANTATDVDPNILRLRKKLVFLGGGKQARTRGGDIRGVVLHGVATPLPMRWPRCCSWSSPSRAS